MTKSLQNDFWERYQFQEKDIEYLFNHLIEVEEPLTPKELLQFIVPTIIAGEKKKIEKQQLSAGTLYLPKNHYEIGQSVVFPILNWESGKVVSIRAGSNPDIPSFEVMEIEFAGGDRRQFAAALEKHELNTAPQNNVDDPTLDPDYVIKNFGKILVDRLKKALEQ
ncbi:MAG: hypothetical protein LWX83_19775, partial [Anaerolineae bacterium]|nr:hypothetical protein [Anaerolineae bacterium]